MKVINLVGGPGAGKTTTALGVVAALKAKGVEAEFVPEYARELTFEGAISTTTQFDILAEQFKRLWRLMGTGIEYAVTDSPLLLQLAYTRDPIQQARTIWAASAFENLYFAVRNSRETHSMVGRSQTAAQAAEIDRQYDNLIPHYDGVFEKKTAVVDILEALNHHCKV